MFGAARFNLAITKDGDDLLFKASNRLGTALELRVSADSLNTLLSELSPKPAEMVMSVNVDGQQFRDYTVGAIDKAFEQAARDYDSKAG